MLDHPACNEIVVVRVQRAHEAKENVFIQKTMDEIRILKNGGPVSRRPSAHDRHTSIHVVCRSNLKIVTFKIRSTKEIPEACERDFLNRAANSLASAYHTHMLVFERSENMREKISRPKCTIIAEYGNWRFHLETY